jgi:RNA polymerase sigma factor (sigma-70 family)
VERYSGLVYASAFRRTGDAALAAEVALAVFLVLARRARKLSRKTVLAGWLFDITRVTCRKLRPKPKLKRRGNQPPWFAFVWRKSKAQQASGAKVGSVVPGAPLIHSPEVGSAVPGANSVWEHGAPGTTRPTSEAIWEQVAPEFDAALDRLSPAQRNAVLLRVVLGQEWEAVRKTLRTSEARARKRVTRGLKKVTKRCRKQGVAVAVDEESLTAACAAEGCATSSTTGNLADSILASIDARLGKKPPLKLARRTLRSLAWTRWRRRVIIGGPSIFAVLATLGGIAWYIDSLTGHSRLITAVLFWSVRHEAKTVPGLAEEARPWPKDARSPQSSVGTIRTGKDLYQTTNIWLAHLKFSREQWETLEPNRIGPLPNFFQTNGTVLLRNPAARRNGLAGVLGLDFNWGHADFELGESQFTNVGARFKGNGTFLSSLYGWKRPFKVDLNKYTKGQKLGDVVDLNFHNLADDRSYMSDALAYEFFRDAGVPAPRTSYAYLSVSVEKQWERHPLGLYAMVETVNGAFAAERFGSKETPLFKPVTYELFKYVGDDWAAYAATYDLKTKATAAQKTRLIEFARLLSKADDAEFAGRVGEFLDLDEFARFLAVEVMLSCYDSILANGQNFYLYLDPRSNKFGFIPWDLDLAWGGFFLLGSNHDRERANLWHPWVGQNRFLERVMEVQEFKRIYRKHLTDFRAKLFVPERLYKRIDELALVVRSPVAAESDFRLKKFDQAVDNKMPPEQKGKKSQGADRPVYPLKRFIKNRAVSVQRQLDGEGKGIILRR